MNTVLIVFLVFVIIVAIYLAVQFYNPSYLIQKSAKLNILNSDNPSNSTRSIIKVESIDNPGSVRYFYEGWFFINTNAPIYTANVLYNRGKDFVVALTGSTLNVYINTINGVNDAGILDTSGLTPLISVSNFPFQKWCQLVVNVDGNVVDLYIDGKFVQNVKSPTLISTSTTDTITYGNKYTVGHVARFRRPAESINPQGVWASYMNGSGQDYSVTNYHLNAQITKNKRVTTDQRLF
jgi:hypothetical protein